MCRCALRILVLTSSYPRYPGDGSPAFVRDLATFYADEAEVMVLTPSLPGMGSTDIDESVQIRRFRYAPRKVETLADGAMAEILRESKLQYLAAVSFVLCEAVAIRRAIRSFNPDVVHAHWVLPQGLAVVLSGVKTPTLLTTHGGDLYGFRGKVLEALKRQILKRMGRITVVNSEMAEIVRGWGLSADDVLVEPMGADVIGLGRSGETGDDGRARTGVVAVGRLVEKKGFHVLMDALKLMPEPPNVTIVGEGPERARLEELSDGLPVRFTGQLPRNEVGRILAGAAMVVVPSVEAASGDKDGLPVAMLEAMSLGVPVISSDLPGLSDVAVDGLTGLIVPPGDSKALAGALDALLGDADRCSRLGAEAAAVAEHYSSRAVGGRYLELLESLAADRH